MFIVSCSCVTCMMIFDSSLLLSCIGSNDVQWDVFDDDNVHCTMIKLYDYGDNDKWWTLNANLNIEYIYIYI